MAITRRPKRFLYDKSYITEALKGKEPNLSDVSKQVKEHKDVIKKQEQKIKLLERQINEMKSAMRKLNSKIISLHSDLSSAQFSIDTIRRQRAK